MYSAVDTSLRVSSRLAPVHLCEHTGTTRLNGIDLGLRPSHSLESCGKLGTVEVEAFACLNRAKGRAGSASNTAGVIPGLVQRAVLLCLLAVTGKGLGQRVSGGGWVRLRSMVDICRSVSSASKGTSRAPHTRRSCALAQEADHGLAASLEDLGCVHYGMEKVRLREPRSARGNQADEYYKAIVVGGSTQANGGRLIERARGP
jgi:hypothetical protein